MAKKKLTIDGWKDLVGLESKTHYLDIDVYWGKGRIKSKETKKSVVYLTTHTFYESGYKCYQRILRRHGFRVKLTSWG